jgi:methylphosphotriester-DNA--protein-cysteine methyltransferase
VRYLCSETHPRRTPAKHNRSTFEDAERPASIGFHPCKRSRPRERYGGNVGAFIAGSACTCDDATTSGSAAAFRRAWRAPLVHP